MTQGQVTRVGNRESSAGVGHPFSAVPNTLHLTSKVPSLCRFYKQNDCLPWLRRRHASPSAATRDCRQTDTCGQVRTSQVRSVHDWSGQVGSGPVRRRQVRSDQVRSPLRINGVPNLELVAIKKNKSVPHVSQRQSPMSHQGSKDCKQTDHETS